MLLDNFRDFKSDPVLSLVLWLRAAVLFFLLFFYFAILLEAFLLYFHNSAITFGISTTISYRVTFVRFKLSNVKMFVKIVHISLYREGQMSSWFI